MNEALQVQKGPQVGLEALAYLGHLLRREKRGLRVVMEPQVSQDPRAHQAAREKQASRDSRVHRGSQEQLVLQDLKERRAAKVTKVSLAPRGNTASRETKGT